MKTIELEDALRRLVQEYFAENPVVFAEVNIVKPVLPFITLKTSTVHRTQRAHVLVDDDGIENSYMPSRVVFEVNLFTRGARIDVPAGQEASYDNTAASDLQDFVNYMLSPYIAAKCDQLDIGIYQKGDVRDVSALLNGTRFEYRAMAEFDVDFMQSYAGAAGIRGTDGTFTQTASGGGTQALADEDIGYFERVEKITEV